MRKTYVEVYYIVKMPNKLLGIGIAAILAATVGITTIDFSQVNAKVPAGCTGDPHDSDAPTGNPHDGTEVGNPHDAASHGGGHQHEGADSCPGAQ